MKYPEKMVEAGVYYHEDPSESRGEVHDPSYSPAYYAWRHVATAVVGCRRIWIERPEKLCVLLASWNRGGNWEYRPIDKETFDREASVKDFHPNADWGEFVGELFTTMTNYRRSN